MIKYYRIVFLSCFCIAVHISTYSQSPKSSGNIEQELKNVLDEWVQNANKKDFEAMRNMLSDDYNLFQLGKRRNKTETIQMISGSGLSDITYTISNVKSESGGTIAFLSFDLDWHGKINGILRDAKAIETYIFRKENGKWKMLEKSVVMMD
jgi:ketosteroid isomerase-like protein